MNEQLRAGAEQAAGSIETALGVLAEIMADADQTGPVRVTAAKAVVDFALKLQELEHQTDNDTLEKLDEVLAEMRNQAAADAE